MADASSPTPAMTRGGAGDRTDVPATPAGGPGFIRALGLVDVILLNLVAVVSLRWIARGARMGPPSLLLWVLAGLTFFVPLAWAVMELSSRYPEQGGIYAWTRRAFGRRHGFLCGWCLWVNNLFYFPSLLLFGAASALAAFAGVAGPGEHRGFSIAFVLIALWLCVGLNVVGLQRAKWLQNVGSLGTWVPAALLIGGGAVAFATFGSATSFAPRELLPQAGFLGSLGLWSAMCFAFSGFEIGPMMGQEVRTASRTLPRAVMIAGAVALVFYLVGTASVLVAVPAAALQERSGIADAVEIVGSRVGLPLLGGLTGLLLALGALAGTNSWTAGAARVPFAAGVDHVLPASFARLHPRYRTPHVALIVQGLATTLVFLASLSFTLGGRRATLQEAYDVMVNLTILIYFIPYLYLFASLARLRREPDRDGAQVYRVPGGAVGLWFAAVVGMLSTAISVVLVFLPPPGTSSVVAYEASIVLQAVAVVAVGVALYVVAGRRSRA